MGVKRARRERRRRSKNVMRKWKAAKVTWVWRREGVWKMRLLMKT